MKQPDQQYKVSCGICGCMLGDGGNSVDQHWQYMHRYDCPEEKLYRRHYVIEVAVEQKGSHAVE